MIGVGLTDEEKNKVIADAIGVDLWVIVKQGYYYRENAAGYTGSLKEAWKLPHAEAKKYEMYAGRDDVPGNEKVTIELAPIPDYLGSLDAMNQAELIFHQDHDLATRYVRRLESIVYKTKHSGTGIEFQLLNATARQRADAFIQCLAKK